MPSFPTLSNLLPWHTRRDARSDPAQEALLGYLERREPGLPSTVADACRRGQMLDREDLMELGFDELSAKVAQGCMMRPSAEAPSIGHAAAPERGLSARVPAEQYDALRQAQRKTLRPGWRVAGESLALAAVGGALAAIPFSTVIFDPSMDHDDVVAACTLGTSIGAMGVVGAGLAACISYLGRDPAQDDESIPHKLARGPCAGAVDKDFSQLGGEPPRDAETLIAELSAVGALHRKSPRAPVTLVSRAGLEEAVNAAGARVQPPWTSEEREQVLAKLDIAYAEGRRAELLAQADQVHAQAKALSARMLAGDEDDGLAEATAVAFVEAATLRGLGERYGELDVGDTRAEGSRAQVLRARRQSIWETAKRHFTGGSKAAEKRFLRGHIELQEIERELTLLASGEAAAD